jgi:Tol biopolymer transport system component
VGFVSSADSLVAGDTNGASDVFVYDREAAVTTRVSVGTGGAQANGYSWGTPALSADGRWVAFGSIASNLVPDDASGHIDVFVHDRDTGATTRVSLGVGAEPDGDSGDVTISADGRWVAFLSRASNLVVGDTNDHEDVFVHDRLTGNTTRVSLGPGVVQGNGDSGDPAISADGRLVAFSSAASNLVAGDTNGQRDVFVHDRYTGVTTRASVGAGGAQSLRGSVWPSISANGRWVGFESDAPNLVAGDGNAQWDVFVRDRGDTGCAVALSEPFVAAPAAGTTGRVLVLAAASCAWTAASYDAGWLTVTDGAVGTGFGIVEYQVAANAGTFRTGVIAIDGQGFTVEQADLATPAAPTELHVHSMAGNLVTLRWTVAPSAPAPTGFVIEGGTYPNDVQASILTGSDSPTFTFSAPTGSYYVRVRALNGSSPSALSNEIRLHVQVPAAPSAPADLLGMVNGYTAALAWTHTFEGGQPTSFVLDVSGPTVFSVPLGLVDHATFSGVPGGTYRVQLRARNAAGWSQPSSALILRFPLPCSGSPTTPTGLFAYRVGRTVYVDWEPGPAGAAPMSYMVNVTGTVATGLTTTERAVSGTVGPGVYTVSVAAANDCGTSPPTAPQTVVVP